jgi:ABC-type sugar transport system ATPase subunit
MIKVSGLSIYSEVFSLGNLSFEVRDSRCAALIGKTGAGKTTLLESICGLRRITNGSIALGNRDVTFLAPRERRIGYVPQDAALFPASTVRGHLEFGPRLRGWNRTEVDLRVEELAELLELENLLDRRPFALSGGETRRVAIARALAGKPEVLLLDEPLTGLDPDAREETLTRFAQMQDTVPVTTLWVTHHLEDLGSLPDAVWELEDGKLRLGTL